MKQRADTCVPTLVGERLTYTITGELDLFTTKVYQPEILAEIEQSCPASIEIDLRQLDFIDSAGLALLLYLYKVKAANGSLRLTVCEGSQIARVLKLGRFDTIFPVDYL